MICPKCNGDHTAKIAYGYPSDEEEYLKAVAKEEIYPGGNSYDNESPSEYCFDCKIKFGYFKAKDGKFDDRVASDYNDSFDFDQGFNLDEVYD